jgi:hypothetical protein
VSTSTIAPLGAVDLEAALVEARRDVLTYRELLQATLGKLHEMTVRVQRQSETIVQLHDEYRALRERCARESFVTVATSETPDDRSAA